MVRLIRDAKTHKKFHPTFEKLIISVAAAVLFYGFAQIFTKYMCRSAGVCAIMPSCPTDFPIKIFNHCFCTCYTFGSFLLDILISIIAPFVLVYLIISVVDYLIEHISWKRLAHKYRNHK